VGVLDRDESMAAWLEKPDGSRVPLSGSLSIGRHAACQVVIADDRVSRHHALIHAQSKGELLLVDLGSRNGTYLNDRRVQHPIRLRNGDRLLIGGALFIYRQSGGAGRGGTTIRSTRSTTPDNLRSAECWLLVADVVGSTQLLRTTPPDDMAMLMGQWFLQSKQLVEAAGGTMNKYLGDGFLAFWPVETVSLEGISKGVDALRKLQEAAQPPFRFVLHRGMVSLGGAASLGEEALTGLELPFVFRMEELASALGEASLVSAAASLSLKEGFPLGTAGEHTLHGFDGKFQFFRFC